MIKLKLDTAYIKGNVSFEHNGRNATMSYIGAPLIPLGTILSVDDRNWRVVQVRKSKFNPQISNVDMVNTGE